MVPFLQKDYRVRWIGQVNTWTRVDRYSGKNYCRITNVFYVSLPFGLEEHDLSVTSEVQLNDGIIYTPAVGVARSKGPVRNECFIASLEVLRHH